MKHIYHFNTILLNMHHASNPFFFLSFGLHYYFSHLYLNAAIRKEWRESNEQVHNTHRSNGMLWFLYVTKRNLHHDQRRVIIILLV